MSIHAVHAKSIMEGEKLVEFRKRPLAANVSHVLVYATKPIGAVVCAFAIAGQQTTSLERLWKTFGDCSGIGFRRFEEYFANLEKGTGIEIGEVFVPTHQLSLKASLGISRPPQNYQYVDSEKARAIIGQMHLVSQTESSRSSDAPRQLSFCLWTQR